MIGAGTIINPILKVVTTVVILGAVYLFIVQPVLDTTENISSEVGRQTEQARVAAQQSADEFDLNFARQRAESFSNSLRTSWPDGFREVRDCVREAENDARAMERCSEFGHKLITQAQSNRNFSLSYASSLDSQGRTAAGDEVRRCVEQAGFKVGPMQRCRNLADRLLFG